MPHTRHRYFAPPPGRDIVEVNTDHSPPACEDSPQSVSEFRVSYE